MLESRNGSATGAAWALEGLKATRPDVAVKFADAVKWGKNGRPAKANRAKARNNSRITRIVSAGKSDNAAYIRARLERDGHTELLAKIERLAGNVMTHARSLRHAPHRGAFATSARLRLTGFTRFRGNPFGSPPPRE
jgi:hypothetical protein